MKKLVNFLLTSIFILSCFVTVFASGYLPSVSYEETPPIVVIEKENGNEVIGYVENAEGEQVSKEYDYSILVTPVADAVNSTSKLSEEEEKLLVETYQALSAEEAKLSEIIPELNEIAKAALGANATADDFVVRELFSISIISEELNKRLDIDGNTLTLTFKIDLADDEFLTVLTYKDGKWEEAKEVINNHDGTVTVKFDHFCPVLFLTGRRVETVSTHSNFIFLAVLCSVVVIIPTVLFWYINRKN